MKRLLSLFAFNIVDLRSNLLMLARTNSFALVLAVPIFFLTLMACTKEEVKEAEDYVLPSITMDSCVVASGNSFTAYMTVDKGESFFNHSLLLLVYDAKDVSHALSTINVELGDGRVQKVQKTFSVPATDNEYLVSAVLKTDKNSFKSRSLMVSMAKMTAESYLRIWGQPRYVEDVTYEGRSYPSKYATDDIALHFSAQRRFGIIVRAAMKGQPVEVKVGDHIYPITRDAWGSLGYFDSEEDASFDVNMTDDIEPGTYEVALHWPGVDLPLPKKIRILPLKAEEEETTPFSEFKDLPHDARASFRIDDKMYYYTKSESNLLVSCDLNTKAWTKHKDVAYGITEIVAIGSRAYGITEEYTWLYADKFSVKNELYEYDSVTDSWKKLSDLPVEEGVANMKMFAAGSNVYVCGGYYVSSDQQCLETWKYDISTGEWKKVADRPTKQNVMQTGNGETNGYFMTPQGFLWVYDSKKDTWSRETQLTSVYETINQYQCLLEHDGKLFYAGNNDNSAIFSYDFKTRKWELLGLYDIRIIAPYMLTGTFHKDKLILGPVLEYVGYSGAASMKFLNFDIK